VRLRFCRHRQWIATNSLYTDMPDESVLMSWTEMACAKCGKARHDNLLRPHEELILPIDEWIEEIT
jgi:hypothetical protein